MTRACTICTSEDRDAIDAALVEGATQRSVADCYRRTEATVRRHATNHLRPQLVLAANERADLRTNALVDRMGSLIAAGETILAGALEDGGDPRLALSAIREVRDSLLSAGKLLSSDQALKQRDEETELLVKALARTLRRHPTVALEFAQDLRDVGLPEIAQPLELRFSNASTIRSGAIPISA